MQAIMGANQLRSCTSLKLLYGNMHQANLPAAPQSSLSLPGVETTISGQFAGRLVCAPLNKKLVGPPAHSLGKFHVFLRRSP